MGVLGEGEPDREKGYIMLKAMAAPMGRKNVGDVSPSLGARLGKLGEYVSGTLVPRAFALLEDGSLMARRVVGHGDLHGGNLMYVEEKGLDFVLVDFDRAQSMPALVDFGAIPFHMLLSQATFQRPYP